VGSAVDKREGEHSGLACECAFCISDPIKSFEHFIIRLKFALFLGVVNFVGIYLWANWHYQYCMIHFVVMISCSIAFLTSDYFNDRIGAGVPRIPVDTVTSGSFHTR
jgi:hypothetical protein